MLLRRIVFGKLFGGGGGGVTEWDASNFKSWG